MMKISVLTDISIHEFYVYIRYIGEIYIKFIKILLKKFKMIKIFLHKYLLLTFENIFIDLKQDVNLE